MPLGLAKPGDGFNLLAVCNLYAVTKGIFPDYPAPIVRNTVEGGELAMARGPRRDELRNTASPHWRR